MEATFQAQQMRCLSVTQPCASSPNRVIVVSSCLSQALGKVIVALIDLIPYGETQTLLTACNFPL